MVERICEVEYHQENVDALFEDSLSSVDAQIKDPSVENPQLTNGLPLKPGIGQNITTHVLPTARNVLS